MSREILLLKDYREHFYSSVRRKHDSMRIDLLERYFAKRGVRIKVQRFSDLDFRSHDYANQIILYQSSEDKDLFYKSYIEDVMLGLSTQGARLIPSYVGLRAHHNKVFMELMRDMSRWPKIQNLRAKTYGTLEDYLQQPPQIPYGEPLVFKGAEGCQGQTVVVARSERQRRAAAEKLSRSFQLVEELKDAVKVRTRPWHRKMSGHRRKFLTQEFIPGLSHDFKVIPCGSRVYLLQRGVRRNDFRASGSGIWTWIEEPMPEILDFAVEVQEFFDVPFASLDVAFNGRECFLFEFQFLMFGTATIEGSPCHFQKVNGTWTRNSERLELEDTIAESVVHYVDRKWPFKSE